MNIWHPGQLKKENALPFQPNYLKIWLKVSKIQGEYMRSCKSKIIRISGDILVSVCSFFGYLKMQKGNKTMNERKAKNIFPTFIVL